MVRINTPGRNSLNNIDRFAMGGHVGRRRIHGYAGG